ncbi:predicted protein [Histoplasma mississippiense (nom. inval.)]|uniref:predicted protein n=1 Tax=Ajellomyces capsulatus (strain NAm1 / WU24) TaxID=2059318 RepID=UPI000157CFF2|nr:predicted protein [Histoplasma mississippiense (nom. inval.)]EDN11426.1 predicted protein [Histoplasma mississippiense (nom. inval.)]
MVSLPLSFNLSSEMNQRLQISNKLFSYGEQALAKAVKNRPKNTNKQYLPKQKKWQISFEDGELVTEKKETSVRTGMAKLFLRLWAEAQSSYWYKNDQTSVLSHFHTELNFLMNHNMLLQGETSRTAQLPDLFTIQLPNEGPTPCWPMILITDNDKTNQLGWLEYTAVDPLKPLSYDTQLQWVNRMYATTGLMSSKKTHLGRSQGSRYAELNGVSEGQIHWAGRWNNDALINCYLTNIPCEFVQAMAGFEPQAQSNYFLPRVTVPPSEQLETAIWPWVDV